MSAELRQKKIYDIVVVGHARPERVELVKRLRETFNVKTYGKNWDKKSTEVQGIEQVRAINSGKIYLSFPLTMAGFNNVKVGLFEAAACRSCIVMPYVEEVERYFLFGTDILGYTNYQILEELLTEHLKNKKRRLWVANNAYNRFNHEHTWEHRWKSIFHDLGK